MLLPWLAHWLAGTLEPIEANAMNRFTVWDALGFDSVDATLLGYGRITAVMYYKGITL